MKLRPLPLFTGITVVVLAACGAGVAAPASLPPRNEANLVVNRFLVAAALGDRATACSLFPSYGACTRTMPLRGPSEFSVTGIALPGRACTRSGRRWAARRDASNSSAAAVAS